MIPPASGLSSIPDSVAPALRWLPPKRGDHTTREAPLRPHRPRLAVRGGGARFGVSPAAGRPDERLMRHLARRRRARYGRQHPSGPHRRDRHALPPCQPIVCQEPPHHRRRLGTGPISGPCRIVRGQRHGRVVLHPASNESSSTRTATPTAQRRVGRSSNRTLATRPTGVTSASAAAHPTNTKPTTATPRATSPC